MAAESSTISRSNGIVVFCSDSLVGLIGGFPLRYRFGGDWHRVGAKLLSKREKQKIRAT